MVVLGTRESEIFPILNANASFDVNKEKEFYVHDSTVDFLDIDEVKLD